MVLGLETMGGRAGIAFRIHQILHEAEFGTGEPDKFKGGDPGKPHQPPMGHPNRRANDAIKGSFRDTQHDPQGRSQGLPYIGQMLALELDMANLVAEDALTLGVQARALRQAADGGIIDFRHRLHHDNDRRPDRVVGNRVAAEPKQAVAEIGFFSRDTGKIQPLAESVAMALFFTDEKFHRLQELWIAMGMGVLGGGEAEVAPLRGFAELPCWQRSRDRGPYVPFRIGHGTGQLTKLRRPCVFIKPCNPSL